MRIEIWKCEEKNQKTLIQAECKVILIIDTIKKMYAHACLFERHSRDIQRERKNLFNLVISEKSAVVLDLLLLVMSFIRKASYKSFSCSLKMGSCISCYSSDRKAKVSRFVINSYRKTTLPKTAGNNYVNRQLVVYYLQTNHYRRESHFTHGFSSGRGGQKP